MFHVRAFILVSLYGVNRIFNDAAILLVHVGISIFKLAYLSRKFFRVNALC